MNCPVCRTEPMIVLELQEVEIDHCFKCKGIWLDEGELEMLLGSEKQGKELITQFQADTDNHEKKVKCPICGKKMEKIIASRKSKILIDRCPKGHGLWFDEGELEALLQEGSFSQDNKVLELLKDMFGK